MPTITETAKQRDAWDEFYQQHDDILEGNT